MDIENSANYTAFGLSSETVTNIYCFNMYVHKYK